MPLHNFYKPTTVTEPYDAKQRIVGAVVLFLIILFSYGILKLLLGMSDGKFVILSEPETIIIDENRIETKPDAFSTYSLPQRFVFLDLNGSPLQEEVYEAEETEEKIIHKFKVNKTPEETLAEPESITEIPEENNSLTIKKPPEPALDICAINTSEKQWYVQAASFRTEKYAQHLVQKIKVAKLALDGCIIKSRNGWYVVYLPPETDYYIVQSQLERLYQLLHLKGLIRKLNGT
jgi:cell division protein FtsN